MLNTIIICGTIVFLAFMVLLSIPQSSLRTFLLQLIVHRGQEYPATSNVGASRNASVKG